MKKSVSVTIIVVCLILALVSFYKFILSPGSSRYEGISSTDMTWVKCKSCSAEYQMKIRDFYEEIKANTDPKMVIVTPGLKCKECGKNTVYQAIKCSNPACGIVFFKGSVPRDLEDRCPKCKQSATEESRKSQKPAA